MKVLGVIPARGGSKGVLRKNIRLLAGKPLISYTIEVAANSRLFRTVVSTDDMEIAEISKECGGDVPFLRPAELATDRALAIPVIQHALRTVEELEGSDLYDAVMMLQPTTPFRTSEDINNSIELMNRTGADSVISVVDVGSHHPARMKYLEGDRLIDPPFCEEHENQPRQELRPMYLRSGAIYLTRREVLLSGYFKRNDCRALIVPVIRAVNIDTEFDFRYAEWLRSEGIE